MRSCPRTRTDLQLQDESIRWQQLHVLSERRDTGTMPTWTPRLICLRIDDLEAETTPRQVSHRISGM